MRKINPSVKALVILVCAIVISFHYSVLWNGVMIGVCLLLILLSGVKCRQMLPVILPVTLAAASLFFAFAFHGNAGADGTVSAGGGFIGAAVSDGNVHTGIALAARIYAYAFLGMLFSFTTDANEFLYSLMQQLHLPPKFAYGVLASYHLMPMMRREYQQIRLAYQVRGIPVRPWSLKPAFPALVNAIHWAENIAMAMESKGFDENESRTWYLHLRIHGVDFLWAAGMIVLAAMGLILG